MQLMLVLLPPPCLFFGASLHINDAACTAASSIRDVIVYSCFQTLLQSNTLILPLLKILVYYIVDDLFIDYSVTLFCSF